MGVKGIIPSEGISEFCQRWKITELALFGSAVRDDFNSSSDLELLVSFASESSRSLFDLVAIQNELQDLLGRPVDLVERSAIERSENYIRRRNILAGVEVGYGAR